MRSSEWPRLPSLAIILLFLCLVPLPHLLSAQELFDVSSLSSDESGLLGEDDYLIISADPTEADDSFTTSRKLLSGWAWSSNIGWISFGDPKPSKPNRNYNSIRDGVYLQPSNGSGVRYFGGRTEGLPGYAWSSAIGWIKFDPQMALQGDFPNSVDSHGVRWDKNSNTVSGWARACAVFEYESACSGMLKADKYRGGWDGWIKFSGESADGNNYQSALADEPAGGPATINNPYIVDGNPVSFLDSYAWGGDLLGWINWRAPGNEYGVDLLGVQAVCRLGPSFTSTSKTVNLQGGQSVGVDWKVSGNSEKADGDYSLGWSWERNGSEVASDSYTGANSSFTSTRTYTCGAGTSASVQEDGYAHVTDPDGQENACTATVRVNCNYIPENNQGEAIITEPTASLIAISSQPLGLSAISSGTGFQNIGGDTTLTIKSSRSMVDNTRSLGDFSAVACRMASSPLLSKDDNVSTCDESNVLSITSGGDVFFHVLVDPSPPRELNLYSPYRIVVGAPDSTEGDISFTFEYSVGTIKQS